MKIHHGVFEGWHELIIGKQGGNQIRIGWGPEGFVFVARLFGKLFAKSWEYKK